MEASARRRRCERRLDDVPLLEEVTDLVFFPSPSRRLPPRVSIHCGVARPTRVRSIHHFFFLSFQRWTPAPADEVKKNEARAQLPRTAKLGEAFDGSAYPDEWRKGTQEKRKTNVEWCSVSGMESNAMAGGNKCSPSVNRHETWGGGVECFFLFTAGLER